MENLKFVLKNILDSGTLDSDILEGLTESEREIVDTIYRENLVSEALVVLEELNTDEEWDKLIRKITVTKKLIVPFWTTILKYAAIFVGLIAFSYTVYQLRNSEIGVPISETAIKLKMDGEKVKVIQEGGGQEIISIAGKVLGVQKGNKISYKGDSDISELVYNELEIPFGKVFDVELSDGTLVHLNSGTKMRYPVKFLNTGKREVFIEGEAYFIVAKDMDRPFIVHAERVEIEVLGTIFNISSYNEDEEINTVLVEGSVKMSNTFNPNDNVMLKPGAKGSWNKAGYSIAVEEVDVENYTSWITGELIFRNASFSDMTKKLERKYNVSIQNNNLRLSEIKLNAWFSTDIERIDDVLKSISEIYPFNYKITDRNIVID
ncbi:FecR domain-containing protein [Arenibacter sp. H213]|uniref:FecR family protein n=1 Tax=Arenibacter antarcticus TaxID=2040469 RepID=A0ABW5VGB5_9FLAO|nr:FecR domain-containing protein [Arenibacter sp. H213]